MVPMGKITLRKVRTVIRRSPGWNPALRRPEAKDLTSSFICSKMYDLVIGEAAEGRTRLALHCRHRGRMSFEAGPAGKSKDS